MSGSSDPITLPAESTTLPVAPSRVPTTLPAESRTVVPSTRSVTVPITVPTVLRTSPVSGSSAPTTLPEASTTLPVAAVEDAQDLAVGAGHGRAVHEVGDRADQVAGRVDHHAGGLVERAEDGAVGGDDVAGGTVEGADDVAGGVHDDAAVDGLARRASARRPRHRRRSPASVPAASIGLIAGAVAAVRRGAPPSTVSLWSMVLSWMPVATASASTVWVTWTPWSARACDARAVAEQVGAHRRVDRSHHVGVERHREVDGGGAVDRQVDVGGEVEDRDDLLVRQCRDALAGQLLGVRVRARPCSSFSLPRAARPDARTATVMCVSPNL